MEKPFPTAAWLPTKPPEPGDREQTEAEVASLIEKLNTQTKHIYRHPYDPHTWYQRGKTLTQLRYPEVAVGDAHKSSSLAQAHLDRLKKPEHQQWRLGCRMGFWMEDESVQDEEERGMLEKYLGHLGQKAHKLCTENLFHYPTFDEGRMLRRSYPWMEARHARRSDELIQRVNEEFKVNADENFQSKESPICEVRRHAFGRDPSGKKDTSDVLGIFATRDITKEEKILIDTTRTWGCNGPGKDGDLGNLHGGMGCLDPLHPNDDSDDVELDLRWIRDIAGKQARNILLDVRMLMCCVQDGVDHHPLDHPLVARLTPTYSENKVHDFDLQLDVVILNRALQKLGVDIFANAAFDTWVLFTIEARIDNNSCGDPMTTSLNPLFCLFNHSCEPNVNWTTQEDHRTIVVKGARDIKKGEQLFVEYDGFMADQPLENRRKRMWRWLDGPCQCVRCVREERERMDGKWKRDSLVASNGDDGKVNKVVGTGEKHGSWDVPESELPVL
jgi:hypothetical protein